MAPIHEVPQEEWFMIPLDVDLLEQMRKISSDPFKVPRIYEVENWYALDPHCSTSGLHVRYAGIPITSSSYIVP